MGKTPIPKVPIRVGYTTQDDDIRDIKRAYVRGEIDIDRLEEGLELILIGEGMTDSVRETYGLPPFNRGAWYTPAGIG